MKDLKTETNNYTDEKSIINYYKKDFHEKINRYFKRSSIIDLVTKYELYYHISLGNYAFETLLDVNETTQKLQDLDLEISPLKVLFKIYKIIEEHVEEEGFENKLEFYIRKEASLHALSKFVENDQELIGKQYYYQRKQVDIENDSFFNEMMWWNFEVNYQKTYEHFNLKLTEELLSEVQKRISNTNNQ